MGGYGTGRWGWHDTKQTVDSSLSISITHFREALSRLADGGTVYYGCYGSIAWSRGGRPSGSMGYMVEPAMPYPAIRLHYTTTHRDGTKTDSNYTVEVAPTCPNYGGRRWWWICPLVKNGRPCNRRVGKLYCPGNAIYFGCRHCYELTYTSCQESHKYDSLFNNLAASVAKDHPHMQGLTGRDVERLLFRSTRQRK
jgi:hypothetical protein